MNARRIQVLKDLIIFFIICCCAVVLGQILEPDHSMPKAIIIANKKLILPAGFRFYYYGDYYDSDNKPYKILRFETQAKDILSAKYLEPFNSNVMIYVDVQPIGFGKGGKYAWTPKDPVYLAKFNDCNKMTVGGELLDVCVLSPNVMKGLTDKTEAIRILNSRDYASIFGCEKIKSNSKSDENLHFCIGSSKVLGSLQVDFYFRSNDSLDPIFVERALKKLIESFYNPTPLIKSLP